MASRSLGLLVPALLVLLAATPVAVAHAGLGGSAVETRFTFPPWMVWAAGAGVVAVSFAIVGGFLTRKEHGGPSAARPDEVRTEYERSAPRPGVTWPRAIALLVAALVAANAFRPGSDSIFPQTMVWLVLWGLVPLLSYTVGNVWPLVSPFEALRPLTTAARGGREPLPYPRWLAAWPAVLFLLFVIGLEVSASPLAHEPAPLALLFFGYVFVTLVGMTLYGDAWLANAELFTRTFLWWHAAAPVAWRGWRPAWRGISGTLDRLAVRTQADVAFTIGILFGVNFDAFLATSAGRSALEHYGDFGVPFPHYTLLLTAFLLFLGVWILAARGIRNAAETLTGIGRVAARFAASLLPIAVGYHLAHNLFTLIENAPRFVVAALDPLGFAGWPEEVLQIPAYLQFTPGLIAAFGVLQVLFILGGHVVAVVAAHRLAFGTFPSRIQAVRSEVPLTLVMVAYTWTGLWLLSGGYGGAA